MNLSLITSGETATRALIVGALAEDLPMEQADVETELAARLARYPGAVEGLAVNGTSPRPMREGNAQIEIGWRAPTERQERST